MATATKNIRTDYAEKKFFQDRLRSSMKRGDKHYKSLKKVKILFQNNFEVLVHRTAYALRHHMTYRSDGGRIARGLVRATGDLGRIHQFYQEQGTSDDAPIWLDVQFWRRKDAKSNRRRVMNIQMAPSEFYVMEEIEHKVDENKMRKTRLDKFVDRAGLLCARIRGENGARIHKLILDIADDMPASKVRNLWHYNPLVVKQYVNIYTDDTTRRKMTRTTHGKLPFDGYGGPHGNWQTYPFRQIADLYSPDWPEVRVINKLIGIDKAIYSSHKKIENAIDSASLGGGDAYGPLVQKFIKHFKSLKKNKKHIYYCCS